MVIVRMQEVPKERFGPPYQGELHLLLRQIRQLDLRLAAISTCEYADTGGLPEPGIEFFCLFRCVSL